MANRLANLYEAFLKKAPQQSRSRSVVEAILLAASQRLARTGDEGSLTVQEVADRAGVGVSSLYDYFRDRKSLLAGLAAKITEDNLRAFEAVLARTTTLPLRESVEAIVDHAFATYAEDTRMPRAVLRIAHQIGLMPTLAQSQNVFAEALAAALRARTDVKLSNPSATAYVLTNALMGVIHALIWDEAPPFSRAVVRETLVELCTDHLRKDVSSPVGVEAATC